MRRRGKLQLKICGARTLGNEKTIYPSIHVSVLNQRNKTSHKKCTVGQKNVYWNEQFEFQVPNGEVVKLELKNRESIFGQLSTIGVAELVVPEDSNLYDVWRPIVDPKSDGVTNGEVHCLLQFEPSTGLSPPTSPNKFATGHQQPSSSPKHGSSVTSGFASASSSGQSNNGGNNSGVNSHMVPPPPPPKPSSLYNPPIPPPIPSSAGGVSSQQQQPPLPPQTQQQKPVADNQKSSRGLGNRQGSDFNGHSAASVINELFHSIEQIKEIIESHSGSFGRRLSNAAGAVVVQQERDPVRLNQLRNAKKELEDIRRQIQAESSISDEWRTKLGDLVDAYSGDLVVLLSTEAWENVERRQSMSVRMDAPQMPPPPTIPITTNAPVQQQQQKPHVPITKQLTLDSIDLFDALIDTHYALKVEKEGDPSGRRATKGDTVRIDYVAYIFDSSKDIAVSYAGSDSTGPLEFTVGDDELPLGLSLALDGLTIGTTFSVWIAPALGYGESGSELVPPDTHLLYEATLLDIVSQAPPAAAENILRTTDVQDVVKNSRTSLRFPARQRQVSLSLDEEDSLTRARADTAPSNVADENTVPPPLPPRSSTRKISNASAPVSKPSLPPPQPANKYAPPLAPPKPTPPLPTTPPLQKENLSMSVNEWLQCHGFSQYATHFQNLGVDALGDLEHIVPSDLEEMGMKPIQIRKFTAQVQKLGIPNNL